MISYGSYYLQRVPGANSAPGNSLSLNVINTRVNVTHTPHARLGLLLGLGEPVVQVVDVVTAGTWKGGVVREREEGAAEGG